MYIEKPATAPNGAQTIYHRIHKVDLWPELARVMINSYVSLENPLIGWQDTHEIPFAAFSTDPIQSIAEWLVSEDGPLAGGTVEEEPAPAPAD